MLLLIKLAILPAIIYIIYIFKFDKCDREPIYMALLCLFYGVFSAAPIILIEKYIVISIEDPFFAAIYEAFVTAALPEELFKLIILFFIIYPHRSFDTVCDGIFYSVMLCMGFVAAENCGYVIHPVLGGVKTAILRGIFSVPCHGIFATAMGYYITLARLYGKRKCIIYAFAVPFLLHGTYDLLLLYPLPMDTVIFILYFSFLVYLCFKYKHSITKPKEL